MARKVADTPLARAVLDLVERHGSDEKLAAKIGEGATRFTVMRWRVDGTVPEKPVYIDRLAELGVTRELLDQARGDDLATRRSLTQRVESLEDQVVDLTTSLEAARQAHKALMRRVAKMEKASPLQGARQATGSTRRGQTAR